ncbi:MAG: TolC family protein [Myxococcota bacterium]
MRWAWLALGLVSLPSWAEAGDGRALTYEEALTQALESNPSLRRARLDRDAAQSSVLSARGQFDPTLGIDGSWRQSRSKGFFQGFPFDSESRSWDLGTNVRGSVGTGTSYSLDAGLDRNFSSFTTNFGGVGASEQIQDAYTSNMSVSVTQQLLKGLRTSFNLQNVTRARQGLTTAELSLEKARQDVLAQTAAAYWAWFYQERLRAIAEESSANAEEDLRVVALRVEAGDLPPVERTRLEAALVQAQASALDAADSAQKAADDLLLLIGGTPGESLAPASKPGDVRPLELDVEAALGVALAQNLDLALARAQLEAAELDATNARHARLPSLSATGSAGIGAQDTTASAALSGVFDSDAFPFLSVAGSFSVPIGNRAARGESERLAITESQRRNSVTELETSIGSQVRQQVRVLESSRRRVELADANLRLAEETLDAEEALAQVGRKIQKDVLEARTQVDRTRAEAAKARTDYRLAEVELLRLQGQLTEE